MKANKYNYNTQTGMYRNRILIRRRVLRVDELLQQIETFEDYGNFWAMIKTLKANEFIGSGNEETDNRKRFVIKYSKTLDEFIRSDVSTFEIVYKGNTYDVKGCVNDNELNETVTITADTRF